MKFLETFRAMFHSSGDESQLKDAIALAKSGDLTSAICGYDIVISSATGEIRASALFNRALAHFSTDDADQAQRDLASVLAGTDVTPAIKAAAREKHSRIQARQRRSQSQRS